MTVCAGSAESSRACWLSAQRDSPSLASTAVPRAGISACAAVNGKAGISTIATSATSPARSAPARAFRRRVNNRADSQPSGSALSTATKAIERHTSNPPARAIRNTIR